MQTANQSAARVANRNLLIALNMLVVFLYWMAQYIFMPTLPVYIRTKTDDLAMVGAVLAMYGLWQAFFRLPLGIVSDWLGWRKPFILACIVLLGVGSWLMGAADGVAQIFIGRILTGVAASAWVVLIVAFNSLFPPEEAVRATLLLTLVNSSGRLVGTASTGFLNNYGGYSLAFFASMFCAALAFIAMFLVKEVRRPSTRPTFASIFSLILRADVLWPSLTNAVVQHVIWGATFGFMPLLAKQVGVSEVMQSMLVSLNLLINISGTLFATVLIKRIGLFRLLMSSIVTLSAGCVVAALSTSFVDILMAQCCFGLGAGIGYPVLMGLSIRQVGDAERGTAMGLHQAIYAVGMFSGPWLSGLLAKHFGLSPMFAWTGAACLLFGLIGTYSIQQIFSHSQQQ